MSERVESLLSTLKTKPSIVVTIQQLIQQDIPGHSQIDAVCACLHMSRTTLYRKLKAQGTSYSEILNQVRMDYVAKTGGENISAEVLSERLGFTDTSAFYKANKRWFPGT